MFDQLTRDDLHELHSQLADEHTHITGQMFTPEWLPRCEIFGPEWNILKAKQGEVHEMMNAVYAEIGRRDNEPADA